MLLIKKKNQKALKSKESTPLKVKRVWTEIVYVSVCRVCQYSKGLQQSNDWLSLVGIGSSVGATGGWQQGARGS